MAPLQAHEILDPLPETKKYIKRRLARAPIDCESFLTPLKLCALEDCEGLCCYDGVCVDDDEERYLTAIMNAHPMWFKELGLTSENAFEDATFLGTDTRKTRSRRHKYSPNVEYPKHFDKTSCVFRFPDGRCSLQALAMEHGEHPWAYKPLSCWLHPISLERDDKTIVWLPTLGNDPLIDDKFPGYAPYTPCGKACAKGGKPAYQVLKMELKTLGAIVGRDIYAEIEAYHKAKKKA